MNVIWTKYDRNIKNFTYESSATVSNCVNNEMTCGSETKAGILAWHLANFEAFFVNLSENWLCKIFLNVTNETFLIFEYILQIEKIDCFFKNKG